MASALDDLIEKYGSAKLAVGRAVDPINAAAGGVAKGVGHVGAAIGGVTTGVGGSAIREAARTGFEGGEAGTSRH